MKYLSLEHKTKNLKAVYRVKKQSCAVPPRKECEPLVFLGGYGSLLCKALMPKTRRASKLEKTWGTYNFRHFDGIVPDQSLQTTLPKIR